MPGQSAALVIYHYCYLQSEEPARSSWGRSRDVTPSAGHATAKGAVGCAIAKFAAPPPYPGILSGHNRHARRLLAAKAQMTDLSNTALTPGVLVGILEATKTMKSLETFWARHNHNFATPCLATGRPSALAWDGKPFALGRTLSSRHSRTAGRDVRKPDGTKMRLVPNRASQHKHWVKGGCRTPGGYSNM